MFLLTTTRLLAVFLKNFTNCWLQIRRNHHPHLSEKKGEMKYLETAKVLTLWRYEIYPRLIYYLVTPQRGTWQNVNPHRAGGDGTLKGIESPVCTWSTYTWRITAAKRRSPRPLLPQIATMRMTVLNFSFARKLQSKLSLPTSYRRCGLGFFAPKPSDSPLFRILARMTFLPPGIFRR